MKLPDAPKSVAALAQQLWDEAIEAATKQARDDMLLDRHELEKEREQLTAEQETMKITLAEAEARCQRAAESEVAARSRIEDLQATVRHLSGQLEAARQQGQQDQARLAASESDSRGLRERLEAALLRTSEEQQRSAEHIRSVEDRAAIEIDKARQETRDTRKELAEVRDEVTVSRRELDDSNRFRATAVAESTALKEQAATLTRQNADLQRALDRALAALPAPANRTSARSPRARSKPTR